MKDYDTLMSLGHYLTRDDIQLTTIDVEVSSDLDITRHLEKDPSAPVFFQNLVTEGIQNKCLGNIWATRQNIAHSFGTQPEKIPRILLEAMESPSPTRTVDTAPFMDNRIKPDLLKMPIPKYYPDDGGRYVTSGVVIVKDSQGRVNMSFHRLMVTGHNRFTMRIVPRHLFRIYNETEGDLDVMVVIGLTPAVLLPAAMSVDYGVNELEIASKICELCYNHPLDVYELDGIPVPNYAEYVLKGRILKQTGSEGPFVDITGTYDGIRDQPILEIDMIYHRDNPVFHALLPGANEHFLMMGMPREPIIASHVGKAVPKVTAVRLTEGGCCWLHGVVAIEKYQPDDGKKAIKAAFEGHRSMKRVVIVDSDIDIFDDREVEWALATRFQADTDQVIITERGSSLDPSRHDNDQTAKLGIDATKPVNCGNEFKKVF